MNPIKYFGQKVITTGTQVEQASRHFQLSRRNFRLASTRLTNSRIRQMELQEKAELALHLSDTVLEENLRELLALPPESPRAVELVDQIFESKIDYQRKVKAAEVAARTYRKDLLAHKQAKQQYVEARQAYENARITYEIALFDLCEYEAIIMSDAVAAD